MTYPVNTGTDLVETIDYNSLYDIVVEVLGPGEDGYGLYNYNSFPISQKSVVRAGQWRNLESDLVRIGYFHITSSTSVLTTTTAVAGGLITADRHNQMNSVAQYVLTNRYTCAEGQYYRDPITGATVNYTDGISSRTIEWGVTENYIEHRVRVRWPDRLIARHFFNTGGYLTWTPFHGGNGLNDIDSEWANFITTIQSSQNSQPIKYSRSDFLAQVAGTTATVYAESGAFSVPGFTIGSGSGLTYEQGTLSVLVELFKGSGEDFVEFKITFANSDSAELVVTPTVGYWNYLV